MFTSLDGYIEGPGKQLVPPPYSPDLQKHWIDRNMERAGTAARLKLDGTPWSAMWKFVAANVVDKADNTNNRYQVAAKMNRLMTDAAWPLW
eukprot:gene46684-62446_t